MSLRRVLLLLSVAALLALAIAGRLTPVARPVAATGVAAVGAGILLAGQRTLQRVAGLIGNLPSP